MRIDLDILRGNAGKFVSIIPFALMLFTFISFVIMIVDWVSENGVSELWQFVYNLNQQFCDIGFMTFVLMLATSRSYNQLSWISYFCLMALWILNTIYILSSWSVDLYFSLSALIIYSIFVILIVRYVLIKREC